MKTLEQVKKIESVVLYVLRKFPEGVDYIKLFKIIYFAQKEYLVNYGKVLCPDTFKARTFGPVPALSDKVIKLVELEGEDIDSYPDLRNFYNSIRVQDQMVYALAEPDMVICPVRNVNIWINGTTIARTRIQKRNCLRNRTTKRTPRLTRDTRMIPSWELLQILK